jgi:hypothetical protein
MVEGAPMNHARMVIVIWTLVLAAIGVIVLVLVWP